MAYYDKDMERQDLEYFIRAREAVVGEKLSLLEDSEAPDFICTRPDGSRVGIEHTKIEYDPENREIQEACREFDWGLDNFAVFWAASGALIKKETKRRKDHWRIPEATILVLDLIDGDLIEEWPTEDSYSEDFADSGFIEVWISDHSTIETHGEVTAIGLYPKRIWGVQGQGYLGRPPYK